MRIDSLETDLSSDASDEGKSKDSWQTIDEPIAGDDLTTKVAGVVAGESKEEDIALEPENDSINKNTQVSPSIKPLSPDDPYFSLENISNPMVVGASNQIVIIRGIDPNGNVVYRLARRVENGKAVIDHESVTPYQYEEFRRGGIDIAGMLDEFLEIAVLNLSDCLNIQAELNKNPE
jgi:hypothetical protein